jgi:EAL domain-containing protein (putative c-di-GMP-specific phosphodiesterase class I)
VETLAQKDFLMQIGCHAFQGYFFSKPLPLTAFESFVTLCD